MSSHDKDQPNQKPEEEAKTTDRKTPTDARFHCLLRACDTYRPHRFGTHKHRQALSKAEEELPQDQISQRCTKPGSCLYCKRK